MLMERINFITPYRYRKALRMMKYADHHGLPIITFIDTPGAFADLKSKELNWSGGFSSSLLQLMAS